MGKSTRKRKLKEADFKKKKLKVGKRLPMPDNVTKTSFKARGINIVQQASTAVEPGEPVNFKHHTLKELLSSCAHYNTQAREEAFLGLKDLFGKHPHVLRDNLNNILQRILDKVTDSESSVRRALLSLIWSIFSTIPDGEVAPFFPSVVAYLCSAMTHINEAIRLDSMKLLDHCLHFYPRLLSGHSKNVIVNFLDVISCEKDGSGVSEKSGIPGMLSLKGKMTSQRTQLQVLTRLNHLLRAIFSVYQDGGSGGGGSSGACSGGGCGGGNDGIFTGDSASGVHGSNSQSGADFIHGGTNTAYADNMDGCIQVPHNGDQSVGGLHHGSTNTCVSGIVPASWNANKHTSTLHEMFLVSDFSLKSASGNSSHLCESTAELLNDESKLMDLIAALCPVLFEYWVECCPAEFAMNLIPVKKTSVSLQIMKEVLEIFVTLIGGLEKVVTDQQVFLSFLKDKLYSQFYDRFLPIFPMSFTLHHNSSKKGRKEEGNTNFSDISLNLLICQLLVYFFPQAIQVKKSVPEWVKEIISYLCDILTHRASGKQSQPQMSLTDVKYLIKLVEALVLNLPPCCDHLAVKLLKSMFQLFEAAHVMSSTKMILLQFLEDIVRDMAHKDSLPSLKAVVDEWLCSLVKLTTNKDLNLSAVHRVCSICKAGVLQNFTNISGALRDNLHFIFKSETFHRYGEETQLLVIEILYHLQQPPSRKLFEVLSTLCSSRTLSLKVFEYLMQVLHRIVPCDASSDRHHSYVAAYLSFVLSLIVGTSEQELTRLQTLNTFPESYHHPFCKDFTLVVELREFSSCMAKGKQENKQVIKQLWEYRNSMTKIICQYLLLSDYFELIPELLGHAVGKLFNQFTALPLLAVFHLLELVKTLVSIAEESNKVNIPQDLMLHTAKWCGLVWHFALDTNPGSRFEEVFKVITKDLKSLTGELCQISSDVLKSMLDLFVNYTASVEVNCTLTCQVITDMLKLTPEDFYDNCQSSVKSLHMNMENAYQEGNVATQIFSDFKYLYQSAMLCKL